MWIALYLVHAYSVVLFGSNYLLQIVCSVFLGRMGAVFFPETRGENLQELAFNFQSMAPDQLLSIEEILKTGSEFLSYMQCADQCIWRL